MNNVVGPISKEDWFFMQELKRSIKYMESSKDPELDFKIAISKEKAILKNFLKAYSTKEEEAKKAA